VNPISRVVPFIAFALLPLQILPAKEENGMRIEVQKTTISRDDERSRDYSDRIDRTLGLKIFAKNTSMKDLGPGKVDWIMIVDRWGYNPRKLERFKGSDALAALRIGEEVSFTAGQSQLGGYKHYSGQYQDKIEGWSVTITIDNKPIMTLTSGSSFEKLNAKAKDASPQ
jgi:hypothetical protein